MPSTALSGFGRFRRTSRATAAAAEVYGLVHRLLPLVAARAPALGHRQLHSLHLAERQPRDRGRDDIPEPSEPDSVPAYLRADAWARPRTVRLLGVRAPLIDV